MDGGHGLSGFDRAPGQRMTAAYCRSAIKRLSPSTMNTLSVPQPILILVDPVTQAVLSDD
jgi:hypothetical protein